MEKTFGDNIRHLRKERGLTQEGLADFLGVSFQSVSKWERNDTFPDILMIPKIPSFFGVSTDYLLGVGSDAQEEKIQQYIDDYFRLWETGELKLLCRRLREGMNEFPGNYRIIVRYLNTLTIDAIRSNQALSVRNEAEALYASIQKHCTTDHTRIWSQKIMAKYYKALSKIENSGIGINDITKILNNMPLMQNSRDFVATYVYDDDDRKTACATAVCELTYLLSQVIINLCGTDIPVENKVSALESVLEMLDIFFPQVDYGKLLTSVIQTNKLLIRYYLEAGYEDKALDALHRCAEMSKKFDSLGDSEHLEYTSPLLLGISVTKDKIPHSDGKPKTEALMHFLDNIGMPEWIELI